MKTGEQLKEEGMKSVEENEQEAWKEDFLSMAGSLLNLHHSVTAEEVVKRIGCPPSHQNSIGAMMRSFAKKHNLIPTYEKSKHPAAHARLVARWSRP